MSHRWERKCDCCGATYVYPVPYGLHNDYVPSSGRCQDCDKPRDTATLQGEQMAAFREVSHCYRRSALPGLDYTHYTMVHGSTREECRAVVERIAAATGVDDYLMLFTKRELKRSSPRYLGSRRDASGETPAEREQ